MKLLLCALFVAVALSAASAGYIRSGWYPSSYGWGGYGGGYSSGYSGWSSPVAYSGWNNGWNNGWNKGWW